MDDPKPGRYRHYKGGEYEVLGVGRHTEISMRFVVYRSVKGELWLRPVSLFTSPVRVGLEWKTRFVYLGPSQERDHGSVDAENAGAESGRLEATGVVAEAQKLSAGA